MLVTAAEKMEWAVMAIALNLHWTTFRLHTMYVLTENLVSDSKILSSLTFNLFTKGDADAGFDNQPILQQYSTIKCPKSYCELHELTYVCSGNKRCQKYTDFSFGVSFVTDQQYIHYLNVGITCLPVCVFGSNDRRMPTINDVASVGNMCQWYNSHGQCPNFEPPR